MGGVGPVLLELLSTEGCVTLDFYIIPMTECTSDKFPLGAQNRITSVILPYSVIENTKFASPGVCFATGEIIYLEGGTCFYLLFFCLCISWAATSHLLRVCRAPVTCVRTSRSFDVSSEALICRGALLGCG